jgi:hypothetical protein
VHRPALHRYRDDEPRAFAGAAVHLDAALHHIHDLAADGQPQAGTQADRAPLHALRVRLEQLRVIGR